MPLFRAPTYFFKSSSIPYSHAETSLSNEEIVLRNSIISETDSQTLQLDNLIEVVCFIFSSSQCWHITLETMSAQQQEPLLSHDMDPVNASCGAQCPWCNDSISLFIKPIRKVGLIQFLVHMFIEKNVNNITPIMLCHQLKTHAFVGASICGRTVNTPPAPVFLNSAILQLIGSNILKFEVHCGEDDNKLNTILRLNYIFDDEMQYGRLAC